MTNLSAAHSVRDRSSHRLARFAGTRVVVAILVAGSLTLLPRSAPAQACRCSKLSIEQAAREASAIFVGKVLATTSRSSQPPRRGAGGQWSESPDDVAIEEATMQVGKVLKGRLPTAAVVSSPAICGYPLVAGGSYLVFVARNDSGLWTDACKPNASGAAVPARIAEVRRALQASAPR